MPREREKQRNRKNSERETERTRERETERKRERPRETTRRSRRVAGRSCGGTARSPPARLGSAAPPGSRLARRQHRGQRPCQCHRPHHPGRHRRDHCEGGREGDRAEPPSKYAPTSAPASMAGGGRRWSDRVEDEGGGGRVNRQVGDRERFCSGLTNRVMASM